MSEHVPMIRALNMDFCDHGDDFCVVRVPYDEKFVGDPDKGVLAGGIITTALDDASGIATLLAAGRAQPVATVALRIDYMRPAEPGRELFAHAHFFKFTRTIAFVRGVAYHDDPNDPIATSVGTFMLTEDIQVPSDGEKN